MKIIRLSGVKYSYKLNPAGLNDSISIPFPVIFICEIIKLYYF